jgi:hypothetical protein
VRKERGAERERLIWQGIVDYANTDFTQSKSALRQLTMLIGACVFELGIRDITEVERLARERQIQMEESVRFWAAKYQPEFNKVLLWLTAPRKHSAFGTKAIQFLQQHSNGIGWVLEPTYERFDATENDGIPVFYFKHVSSCASIMAPICAFLCERIEQFQDGGRKLLEAIPIRVCDRPGCGRFKLPTRQKDKCYCSGKCRSADHQSQKSPQEKADYMADYRKRPPTFGAFEN